MYDTILVTLDGTPTDRAIIEHVKQLAKLAHSRWSCCMSPTGWAARTYGRDAVSPEITEDTAYLKRPAAGIPGCRHSRRGRTGLSAIRCTEIVKWVEEKGCDLVAMSTHGHRFLADFFWAPPPAGCSTA